MNIYPAHRQAHKPIIHRRARLTLLLGWALTALPLRMAQPATLLIGGGLLLLRWPWLIWPGIGATLPWLSAVAIGPLSLTDLALAGAVALWFADGVRRRSLRLNGSPVLALLLLYIAIQCVSLLHAPNMAEAAAEVVKWGEVALVCRLFEAATADGRQFSDLGLVRLMAKACRDWASGRPGIGIAGSPIPACSHNQR